MTGLWVHWYKTCACACAGGGDVATRSFSLRMSPWQKLPTLPQQNMARLGEPHVFVVDIGLAPACPSQSITRSVATCRAVLPRMRRHNEPPRKPGEKEDAFGWLGCVRKAFGSNTFGQFRFVSCFVVCFFHFLWAVLFMVFLTSRVPGL